jgi:hypothetical protein
MKKRDVYFLVLMVVLLTAFAMCTAGCATRNKIEYVDRDVVRYEKQIYHDTLINNVHDSIFQTVYQRGDTVYNVKYVEKIKYTDKYVYQRDTVWRDSVRIEYKEKVVEKTKNKIWSQIPLAICGLFLIFALVRIFIRKMI